MNKRDGMETVYDALDIAKYVISYCDKLGRPINNLQLQKIVYYLQGCYLGKYKKPLFKQHIENWQYGPVVPVVYLEYKEYRRNKIKTQDVGISHKHICQEFDTERIDFINRIIENKSKYTSPELVSFTLNEDPYRKTVEYQLIDIFLLQEYFSTKGKYHYE